MSNEHIIERLTSEIDTKYSKRKDLAQAAGLTESQVSTLVRSGKYNIETYRKLSAAGIDMNYVETGERSVGKTSPVQSATETASETPSQHHNRAHFRGVHKLEPMYILLYESPPANAGRGIDFTDRQNTSIMAISNKSVRHDREAFAVPTSGESMTGAGIDNGDILVVEVTTNEAEINGEVVVATVNGLTIVKRFLIEDGRRIFRSETSNGQHYEDIIINSDTMYIIHGIVVEAITNRFRRNKRR